MGQLGGHLVREEGEKVQVGEAYAGMVWGESGHRQVRDSASKGLEGWEATHPTAGVHPGLGKVKREPRNSWPRAFPLAHSAALGNSTKRPLEWGLWAVTLGTAALCWGCCSCLGVISHSPLCLQGHPE